MVSSRSRETSETIICISYFAVLGAWNVALRIFVYELVCGGGWLGYRPCEIPPASLAREGAAMLTALAADFAAIDGVQVMALRDARFASIELPRCEVVEVVSADDEQALFRRLAHGADWTVVIAPETDGILAARCRAVEHERGRLLGPSPALVDVASDKVRTASRLLAAGIPVPEGVPLEASEPLPTCFPYPAVMKRRDAAGSQDMRLIAEARGQAPYRARLERYIAGVPASVAFLCGPHGEIALPACHQRLSNDGTFSYLGGSLPLEDEMARRATRLAARALRCLGPTLGYLGVDLVLAKDPDGRRDVVIEINPRLTTSYVGLRAAARHNLAAALLAVASGCRADLSFTGEMIEFTADGNVCGVVHR